MEAPASAPTSEERAGYPSSTVAAAVIATLFFPVVSLIAALFLLGNQSDPARRSALRTWALAAAAWLALQAVVAVLMFAAFWAGSGGSDLSGPCVGGPKIGAAGRDIAGNGTKFVVPCAISGTTTVDFPNR